MDHTGDESVPTRVSLLEAHGNEPGRVAVLQERDGYAERLDVAEPVAARHPTTAEFEALLADVPVLRMLSADDVRTLAASVRPLLLGPTERFVVQGGEGTSLFVVADGDVEVLLRREDGKDVFVETMGRGEVIGEFSLLTGEERSATVRAVDSALVLEIGHQQYAPLLRAPRVDRRTGRHHGRPPAPADGAPGPIRRGQGRRLGTGAHPPPLLRLSGSTTGGAGRRSTLRGRSAPRRAAARQSRRGHRRLRRGVRSAGPGRRANRRRRVPPCPVRRT